MSFKMTEENAVLVSEIAEILKELKPGEAITWAQLPELQKNRSYFVKQAAKLAGIDCDWDKTGVLRCNPKDETTLRRVRKSQVRVRNGARRMQRLAEVAAANLSPKAPVALHQEASHLAGQAGTVRGFLSAKTPMQIGINKPAIPILKT